MTQATDIKDVLETTMRELGRLRFQQIAQELTEYEVLPKWLKKDKVMFDSGYGIQRTILNKLTNNARHVGLTDESTVVLKDMFTHIQANWVHAETKWAWEYRSGVLMNRGNEQIVSAVKGARIAAMIDLAAELENKAFDAPSATDTKLPWALKYWITRHTSTGFYGGAASGFTTKGGVSDTKLNNYTAQYTTVNKADLIKKMRTAARAIKFKSPVEVPDFLQTMQENQRIYVNETTISSMEDIGEGNNENLGRDLASMDGQMVFHGHPIVYVPKLDADTYYPVYMVDHRTFYPVVLKGDYLREVGPIQMPTQPNMFVTFLYLTYNYLCIDPRRNALIAK